MYQITLFVDFEEADILDEVTADFQEAFDVIEEELHEDDTISFVLETEGHQSVFLERMADAAEIVELTALDDSSLLVRKQAKGAANIIRRNHGKLNGVDKVRGTKRVFDVLILRKSDLRPMVEELREFASVQLGRVVTLTDEPDIVTERQQEAVTAALELGYFDWPRSCDAEELADHLGVAHPTALEHLRKGEKKLLQQSLGGTHSVPSERGREYLLPSGADGSTSA